jgi:hypothetical protein
VQIIIDEMLIAELINNCATMAVGLISTLKTLSKVQRNIRVGGTTLSIQSAELRGFAVCSPIESELMFGTEESGPDSRHRFMEGINHVVVVLKEEGEGPGVQEFVVDLAAAQFGIFGAERLRPQIVVEELDEWMKHFRFCRPAVPVLSYPAKTKLMEAVSICISQAFMDPRSRSVLACQKITGKSKVCC